MSRLDSREDGKVGRKFLPIFPGFKMFVGASPRPSKTACQILPPLTLVMCQPLLLLLPGLEKKAKGPSS